jgi:hypothetical protein
VVTKYIGQAGEPDWWWFFLGRQARADSLISTTSSESSQLASVPPEVYFSGRLAMASRRKKCHTLNTWKTVRVSNKVQWQSRDGPQKLDGHNLGQPRDEDRKHDLLLKWCNREFSPRRTDRAEFVKLQKVIEDPESEKRLRDFADFLLDCMAFVGNDLAPSKMYPLSTRRR